jgi:hypothetical protein
MKSDHGKTPVNIRAFPRLDATEIGPTLNAVHAYTQVLGDWLGSSLPKRKHWWQLTVQPSIGGISSGLVQAGIDFEFELDLAKDRLLGRVAGGEEFSEPLSGRPAKELAELVQGFLLENGIDPELIPADKGRERDTLATPDYSVEIAASLGATLRSVKAAFSTFQAGIREESSPIQIWPHHFDLGMLWLPGAKVAGQDIANEEYADSSMNFGFTFGDEGIPEPYFYITAYPLPDALPDHTLPPGTYWHNEGFSGAVLPYRSLLENSNPADYLVDLWNDLLTAGRKYL